MTDKPVTTTCTRCELTDLITGMFGETTPAEWADRAMNRATIRKTKRPYLRPHLAAVFAEAMKEAKEFVVKEIVDAGI